MSYTPTETRWTFTAIVRLSRFMSPNVFLEVAAVAELHLTDVAREPSTFVVRLEQMSVELVGGSEAYIASRSGATPGRATSNDLAGRSTALPIALLQLGCSLVQWRNDGVAAASSDRGPRQF